MKLVTNVTLLFLSAVNNNIILYFYVTGVDYELVQFINRACCFELVLSTQFDKKMFLNTNQESPEVSLLHLSQCAKLL